MTDKQLGSIERSLYGSAFLICSVICYTDAHPIWGTVFLLLTIFV